MITAHPFGLAACGMLMVAAFADGAEPMNLEAYDVVWHSPSLDARGSMPLGNGDVSLNAWIEADGGLVFYIGKTDAWDDNNRLLKIGRVRVTLNPNPFAKGGTFRQELRLRSGEMVITASGPAAGDSPVEIHLWVDACRPIVQVTVDAKAPLAATVTTEIWRTAKEKLASLECSDIYNNHPNPPSTVTEPDTVLKDLPDGIGWYHRNIKSVGPELTMKCQDLMEAPWKDPLLHRIFGALVRVPGGKRIDDRNMESPLGTQHRISVYVLTQHPATADEWLTELRRVAGQAEAVDFNARRKDHQNWWEAFWNRSHIYIRDRETEESKEWIPANSHVLKIGLDQAGESRFNGSIARASLLRGSLAGEAVRGLLKDREKLTDEQVLASLVSPEIGSAIDIHPGGLNGPVTMEAWIKVDEKDCGGRIFDKITVGKADGFLFDTWPGRSLRLIVGGQSLHAKDALSHNTWHHVAAVIERAGPRLYLDGKQVSRGPGFDITPGFSVASGYNLQRFITACAGRGAYPIKFNGSTFVMPWPEKPGDADYRRWGPGYWWQNTRLPYLSSCTAGDYDLLDPLFRMYAGEVLEVSRFRTKHYFGFDGAYYPECIYPWGAVFMQSYGWGKQAAERTDKLQDAGWHKWEWVCGLELVFMMQDYFDHLQDERFLTQRLLPTARAVLAFFDNFYKTDEHGKLVMHPSQSVETWWQCTNPMPELAGLHAVCARLLALPGKLLPKEDRRFVEILQEKLPDLPTRSENGVRMLAPAEKFAVKKNCENPELYAVFPFRLCSFEKPNAELGIQALRHCWDRGDFGWRQDDLFMAYLGMAKEAKANVVSRAQKHDPLCRFPAFWGPNYDWTPDQDHGGVLMRTVQAMLMQTEGRKIFLLPAWPRAWDVDFKLHAPFKTIVEGSVRDGKITELKISPEARRKDVAVVEQR